MKTPALLLLGSILLTTAGCVAPDLTPSWIMNKKVEQQTLPGGEQIVLISGFSGHSAYVVESYTVTRLNAKEQLVVVRLALAREHLSGTVSIPVKVGPGDETIYFGAKREVIWRR